MKDNFKASMEDLRRQSIKIARQIVPVRTGNMQNSIKTRDLPNGGFELYVDQIQAPYAPYTTEPWTDGRWGGRENPNLGWDKDAARMIKQYARIKLGGRITKKGVVK